MSEKREVTIRLTFNPYPLISACDQAQSSLREFGRIVRGEPDPFEDRSTWAGLAEL